MQTGLGLGHVGRGIRPQTGAVLGLTHQGLVPGHIALGERQDVAAAQKVDVGDDAVQRKGRGCVENTVFDRFQRSTGRTHARTGGKTVPDGLHQLRAYVHQAPHLRIKIFAAGGGVAQHAAAGTAGHVNPGAEARLGAIQLMLQHLPVFLHAAQVSVRTQHAIDGICNTKRLSRRGRRRICGLGATGTSRE